MKSTILRQRLTFFISLTTTIAWGQFASLSDSLLSPSAEWHGDTAFMNFTQDGLRSNAPAAGSLLWSRPTNWINTEPPTGIYVVHIYLKTSQKNTWEKIPLSIYNP